MRERENKKGEKLAERWYREWTRIEKLHVGLETYRHEHWKGLTNTRAGPPSFLDKESQMKWKAEIIKTVRQCTRQFWVPFQTKQLQERWIGLREELLDNIKLISKGREDKEGESKMIAVAKGIANVINKQSKKEEKLEGKRKPIGWIPPPPKERWIQKEEGREMQLKIVDLGVGLRRGEEAPPVNSRFIVEGKIGVKRDPITLLAWAIYGCRKRENFVYRSIIKYLDREEEKGRGFKSRWVKLKKGGNRKVDKYGQYRQILYAQKSWIGKEEFGVIATLYQIQVRIFQERNNRGSSNVVCRDQIGKGYSRSVDLLDKRGEWAILCRDTSQNNERGRESIVNPESPQKCRRGEEIGEQFKPRVKENREGVSSEIGEKEIRSMQRSKEGEHSINNKGNRQVERKADRRRVGYEGGSQKKSIEAIEKEQGSRAEDVIAIVETKEGQDSNKQEENSRRRKEEEHNNSETLLGSISSNGVDNKTLDRPSQRNKECIIRVELEQEKVVGSITQKSYVSNITEESSIGAEIVEQDIAEVQSDSSSIELLDREKLDRFIKLYQERNNTREKEQVRQVEESVGIAQIEHRGWRDREIIGEVGWVIQKGQIDNSWVGWVDRVTPDIRSKHNIEDETIGSKDQANKADDRVERIGSNNSELGERAVEDSNIIEVMQEATSQTQSEISSVDLLDRETLDTWWKQYTERTVVRYKQRQLGEEIQQPFLEEQLDRNEAEPWDRYELEIERRQHRESKSMVEKEGWIEAGIEKTGKHNDKEKKENERLDHTNLEVQSDVSSIELVDRKMLDKCIQQHAEGTIREEKVKDKLNKGRVEGIQIHNINVGNISEEDREIAEDEQYSNLQTRMGSRAVEGTDRITVDNSLKPNIVSNGGAENEQKAGVEKVRVGKYNKEVGDGSKVVEHTRAEAQLEVSALRALDSKGLDEYRRQKEENRNSVEKGQAELVKIWGERAETEDSHCSKRKEEVSKRVERVKYISSEVKVDSNRVALIDRNWLGSDRQQSKKGENRVEREQERRVRNSKAVEEIHKGVESNRREEDYVEVDSLQIQTDNHLSKRIDNGLQSNKREDVEEDSLQLQADNFLVNRINRVALERNLQHTIRSIGDRREVEVRVAKNRAERVEVQNNTMGSQYIDEAGNTSTQRGLGTEKDNERNSTVEYLEEKIEDSRGKDTTKIEDNRVRNREEGVRKAIEERVKVNEEVQSENSSVDLVDREMLDRCLHHYRESTIRAQREEDKQRKELAKRVEILIEKGVSHNYHTGDIEEEQVDIIIEEVADRGIMEDVGATTEESKSTSSSIAALFRDERLEREGKKVGRKNVTRRKVWERWKGVVRGEIRRDMRRKNKLEKIENNQREDNKMVFDFTTKGLSANEVKLLGRGEAFCIVDHKIDVDRSKVDIYQYQRRLRLHELFRDPGIREVEGREEICTPRGGGENGRVRQIRESRVAVRTGERGVNTQTREGRRSIVSTIGRRESVRESRGRQGDNIRESVILGDRHNTINRNIGTQQRDRRESGVTGRRIRTPTAGTRNSRVSITIRDREGEKEGRRLPSIYDPDSQNRNLNRYNTCIQEEIMLALEDKKVKFIDNITKEEREGLKTLKQRVQEKEIIITRADKGSGLVAVDYDKYISKGTKYIEEEAGAYSKVQDSEQVIIGRLTKERNKIAEKLKETGVIGGQTATYIRKQLEEKITGIKFYYKIHKDRRIDSMPLRPLQSCIKSPIQHLSIILTDILQPLLNDSNIQSFIFDSNQLLYRLNRLGSIPYGCTIISSDVSALYPSIPHEEGFKAMEEFLIEYTSYDSQQVESIIRALELVITENYMSWNSQIYKQTSGVAMGTPVAVAYANIFMNWVDREVRRKAPFIHEHIRYIDDNLFIVPVEKVEQLIAIANNILPPYIKFTYEKLEESSGKGLPFLDTQLFIGVDNSIESRLYTKATDRHAYLLPSSYHPPHVTKNIPSAVFGRVKKICSREEWFEEDAQKAVGWLSNRGYKDRDIQKALSKVRLKNRWGMIEKIESNRKINTQKKEEIEFDIPLIITYNQHVSKIRQVLKDRQPLLDSAFRRTKVRPRLSFRRKRNLNDTIVQKGLRGPIEQNREDLNIFNKCGETPGYRTRCPCKGKHSHSLCRCCMHSKGRIEGIEYKLFKPVSCNSKNIIYMIGCSQCEKRYVGETQQRLKDRLAQHMYNVEKLNQPLYLHFRYRHKLEYMHIGILETVRGVEPFMRKVREAWWINQLKTLEPSGFNVKLECNQTYNATG